jgi:hypothetical protein
METLTKRVARLEREVKRLKRDPDTVMTPADVKAVKPSKQSRNAKARLMTISLRAPQQTQSGGA